MSELNDVLGPDVSCDAGIARRGESGPPNNYGSYLGELRTRAHDRIDKYASGGMGVSPRVVLGLLDAYDALERLVADIETNSEAGAPDYAHDVLKAFGQ